MYHVEGKVNDRGKMMTDRYLERMTLKDDHSSLNLYSREVKFSNERSIRIRHAPSKGINNMNSSLSYRLELFSLCSSDVIMPARLE